MLALPVVVAAADRAGGGLTKLQTLHGRALEGARGVAVSPDGKNVYVTAAGPGGGVAVFARDGSGKLSQLSGSAGCVTESGSGGKCTKARGVKGASSLAVSANGKSVYVVSFNLAILSRNPKTGALTPLAGAQGCLGSAAGCGKARGVVAGNVGSVTVSPDGKSVYVGSHRVSTNANHEQRDEGAVAVFARGANGALKQLSGTKGCVSLGGFDGCDSASLLGTIGSLAVSPDGKNVYVGSETNSEDFPAPSAVLTFTRAGDGSLAAAGCVARTKRQGCSVYEAIFTPTSMAVSADGKNVYVTALQTHSVTFLSRAAAASSSRSTASASRSRAARKTTTSSDRPLSRCPPTARTPTSRGRAARRPSPPLTARRTGSSRSCPGRRPASESGRSPGRARSARASKAPSR